MSHSPCGGRCGVRRTALGAAALFGVLGATGPASAASDATGHRDVRVRGTHARVAMYERNGVPVRLYGQAFSHGTTARASADAFLAANASLTGVAATDLAPPAAQPVMPRGDGTYKFTLLRYAQSREGIPVFRGEVRLLTRNETGYPLVWANLDSVRDVRGFRPDARGIDAATVPGHAAARVTVPGIERFRAAEVVVFAGIEGAPAAPVLAHAFVGEGPDTTAPGYRNWLFVTDARTGAIVHAEDRIVHVDVTGRVSARATPGPASEVCAFEVSEGLPYARVDIVGGNFAFADVDGNYVIPNEGAGQVTVESYVRGQWFEVFNFGGPQGFLDRVATPPGPVNFVHNPPKTSEFPRAEVNAYIEANVARDFALAQNPLYPQIGAQEDFPVNVNLNGSCNAFYFPDDSINFLRANGQCANAAFAPIVHHEYGHHLVHVGQSGQGEYGEGMADTVAVLILDEPRGGLGFRRDCNESSRTADNDCRYLPQECSTCGSEIHACGQVLSGCVWDTRMELAATEGDDALAIISCLTVNSILLHSGTSIDPRITTDFLVLDDDDGDIFDGTPHYLEIATAFGAHDMPAPVVLSCEGDVDRDGAAGFGDILLILAAWGQDGGPEDVDRDGTVGFGDVLRVLARWGTCPGACCFDDGTCVDRDEITCAAAGGTYQGSGTTCSRTCLGACCFTDGSCDEATPEPDCVAAGGFYRGDASLCGSGCTFESDECTDADTVGDGVYAYSTVGSSTDGPPLPKSCDEGGGIGFERDVWFRYVASCDGTATASVCDSNFNTRMAVYEDGDAECTGALLVCNDSACGIADTRSSVGFPVEAGVGYLIRIGGRGAGSVGSGTLELSCSP